MATKKSENVAEKQLKVTLVKSTIGSLKKHKQTVQALGLKKIGSSVVVRDNAAMRGMIFAVKHLVNVQEVQGE